MPQMAKNYRHFINQAKPDPSYPTAYNHILIDNIENLKEILSKPTDYMSFDTETTGLSPEKDFIVGYSFCLDGRNCYYVPVKHSSGGLGEESLDLIYNKMCSVKTVAMFNMRFDVRMMEWHGFTDLPFGHQYETAFVDSHFIKYDMSKVKVFDVQVSVFLADTNVGYPSLKWAEEWFLGWKGDTFSETLGDATNFYYLSPEEAYFYAATDALGTYLLGIKTRRFYDEAKTSGILDNNFLYPLCKFEEELVDVDVDVLKGYSQYLSNEIEACQKRCWERAGTPFNLGSTKEKSDVLEALGVYTGERTKKGTMKTGRDVIEKALHQMDKADPNYKLLEDMVLYNTLVKQKSSYVDNIIDMCDNPIRPNKLRFNYKNCAVPCLTERNNVCIKGRGIVSIKDVREGDYIWTQFGWKKVLWKHIKWSDDNYKIVLKSGQTLEGTGHHPVLVNHAKRNKTPELEWCGIKALHKNESVCLNSHQVELDNKVYLPTNLSDRFLNKAYDKDSKSNQFKLPEIMTEDLARMIGFLDGDGSVSDDRIKLVFNSADIEMMAYYVDLFERLFDTPRLNAYVGKDNTTQYTFWCPKLATWLKDIGVRGERVSQYIMSSGPKYWVNYLAGLWDTDGTFCKNGHNELKPTYNGRVKTNKKYRMLDVSQLLIYLGIQNKIREVSKNDVKPRYEVSLVGTASLIRFRDLIAPGLINKEKKRRCLESTQSTRYFDLNQSEVIEIHIAPPDWVYDIEVEDVHEFISNGIVTHNTGRLAAGGDKKQDFFANLNIQNQPKPHVLNYFVGNIDRVKQTNPDLFLNAYNDDGSLKDRWDYTNEVRTYSIERVLNFIFTPIYYKGKFGGSNPDDFPFKLPRDEERLIEGFEQHLNIRSAYLPRPGHYWVSLDFNAEELRLPTLITKEKVWMDAFVHGRDIHRSTAEAIWGKENYTKDKRKIAKCVSGDTLINTTEGLIPIKDLSDYRVEDSFTDINCRVVTRDGVHKVDYFYYGGIKDTYKIETDKGYKIEVSNTHPLLVLRNNKDEWVKSSELKVGDLVRTCNYVYDVDKYQEVSVNLWYNLENTGTNLPKVVIDENYGFLLGAILGDGTCGVKGVKFMTWKEDFLSIEPVISKVLSNVGLSSTRPYNDRNLVVWSIGSTRFIRFLKKIGISNGHRKILRVPECIFRSPNSVIGEFLSGLFETDGTVYKDTISFCSSNLKFVEDIQQLLLKIGIRSKIKSELNKAYNRYYHKIRIYKEDCKLFEARVGFKSDRKKSRLAEMSSRYKTKNLDYTEITSIVKSRNEVFDLTVSDVHEFVGNGIVCHNTANFGILYGMNYYSFADRYAMSLEEAQKFVNDFKTSLSTLFSWVSKVEKLGADKGTLYTMFGRPRRVSYWMTSSDYKQIAFGKRTAVNTIIQGSGADVLKIAFIKLWNKFFVNWNNHKYISFLNTVHDEINYSIDKSKVNEITKLVIPCMRLQLPGWEFPMEVGLEIGNRWGQTFAFAFDKKTFDILEPKSEPIPEFEEEKEEEKEVEEQKLTEVQEFLFNTDGEEIVF